MHLSLPLHPNSDDSVDLGHASGEFIFATRAACASSWKSKSESTGFNFVMLRPARRAAI